MSISMNQRFMENGCPAYASEELNVTVPIMVRGIADVGDVAINCMGSPIITRNSDYTPGSPNAISRFTVSQRVQVDIPLVFGAEAEVGEGRFQFASSDENDNDHDHDHDHDHNHDHKEC